MGGRFGKYGDAKRKAQIRKNRLRPLAKAFSGELVPTEVELARRKGRSYEPASVLLAKIDAQRKDVQPKPKRRWFLQRIKISNLYNTRKGWEIPS